MIFHGKMDLKVGKEIPCSFAGFRKQQNKNHYWSLGVNLYLTWDVPFSL